jgi:hypothetical protein
MTDIINIILGLIIGLSFVTCMAAILWFTIELLPKELR